MSVCALPSTNDGEWSRSPDLASEELTTCWQTTRFSPESYHYFARLESTNATAMAMGRQDAPHGTLVVADCQTRGRGRGNRVWVAPPGRNLSFSILLRPNLPAMEVHAFTLLAGVALAQAMDRLGLTGHHLKWPNDLYVAGRKLAGILTESSSIGGVVSFLVVGMGVNVNALEEEFPLELQDRITSLARQLGQPQHRGQVLAAILTCFDALCMNLRQNGFPPLRQAWTGYWRGRGKMVKLVRDGQEIMGVAQGLDDQGRLLVRRLDGVVIPVASGEVFTMEGAGYVAGG